MTKKAEKLNEKEAGVCPFCQKQMPILYQEKIPFFKNAWKMHLRCPCGAQSHSQIYDPSNDDEIESARQQTIEAWNKISNLAQKHLVPFI